MIYVTGDCHGDFTRFSSGNFPEQKEMTKDDFVIILGDFGLVWKVQESNEEKWWIKWLNEKPFTTLFVCGNHENFDRLYQYPVVDFHGGKAHKISDSVYHLMRGDVFNLQGKKFFAFGGASSHDIRDGILDPIEDADKIRKWQWDYDRLFRINHVSWWKEELPSEEEMNHGLDILKENNWKVDYILTHCAPQQVANIISQGFYKPDILTMYFNGLLDNGIEFTNWFLGHYHDNRQVMSKFIILYEQIIRVV
jgi:hypothetical protein